MLGFLYADGCVCQYEYGKYRALEISLSQKDHEFLQSIVDIFNYEYQKEYKLKYNEKTNSYRFTFLLCEPIQKLVNLGIHNNKTYENDDSIFLNIPDNLKHHFFRGYFDGDGTVGIYQNKARGGIVSLNNKLLNSMMSYLHLIGLNCFILHDKKYTRLCFSGNPSCIKIAKWMYQESTICLQRKYNIFQQIPGFKKEDIEL